MVETVLILEAIRDELIGLNYHDFQAKQHPAWYDKVNGELKQNKTLLQQLDRCTTSFMERSHPIRRCTEIMKRKAIFERANCRFQESTWRSAACHRIHNRPRTCREHGIGKTFELIGITLLTMIRLASITRPI